MVVGVSLFSDHRKFCEVPAGSRQGSPGGFADSTSGIVAHRVGHQQPGQVLCWVQDGGKTPALHPVSWRRDSSPARVSVLAEGRRDALGALGGM